MDGYSFEGGDSLEDLKDLILLLKMRFGELDKESLSQINELSGISAINRMILVAANVDTFEEFIHELRDPDKFKLTGEKYRPSFSTKEVE